MAMTVTTVSLPDAEVGVPYSVTLQETGGIAPISWALTAGILPTGLTLHAATGVVDGTPTGTVAATPLTFEATDSTPVTPQTASSSGLTLTVDAALAITTTSLPSAKVGTAYSATLAASGGATPYAWSITSGALPAGLSLNASTGVISGTPTATASGSITFHVTDADGGSASKSLSLATTGSIQPKGSATVKANVSATFPLMPQCWPLTVIPGSDPVSAKPPQNPNPPSTTQAAVIAEAEVQAGTTGNRLV
jgi:hypothetical protein